MLNVLLVLQQDDASGSGLGGSLFGLLIAVLMIASFWKLFTKAGQPGWASIIPLYNLYVLLKIGGKPGWWILMFFIPFVNLVFLILTWAAVARSFGKGLGFTVGLILLSPVFVPILAFGNAQYQGQPTGLPAGMPA